MRISHTEIIIKKSLFCLNSRHNLPYPRVAECMECQWAWSIGAPAWRRGSWLLFPAVDTAAEGGGRTRQLLWHHTRQRVADQEAVRAGRSALECARTHVQLCGRQHKGLRWTCATPRSCGRWGQALFCVGWSGRGASRFGELWLGHNQGQINT